MSTPHLTSPAAPEPIHDHPTHYRESLRRVLPLFAVAVGLFVTGLGLQQRWWGSPRYVGTVGVLGVAAIAVFVVAVVRRHGRARCPRCGGILPRSGRDDRFTYFQCAACGVTWRSRFRLEFEAD